MTQVGNAGVALNARGKKCVKVLLAKAQPSAKRNKNGRSVPARSHRPEAIIRDPKVFRGFP
ncbi:hypothetical protein GKA01_26400 [Gluconobacter kanchanaburiensis NBRC 103587]|uniref:Uncharacterized protein n=1 Tax=Gluconobacter kanchanaburiensis NBRC 103587 TaxID=1307948 RepID=A0A511BCW8_9PROT|nr:hypothetical protein AA103587_2439 [Gluconobacter kanchanaburiensis NBRC 103587]GEK97443.1 hypothetical protein GKA01_26400 [Gluconobacter kanchanaburiensis NBRC 103587]